MGSKQSALDGYIAPTDKDWFEFLSKMQDLDEVNFWQPSGGRGFHAIPPGAPFFFKLKTPYNKIGGFGFLSRHQVLPAWLAWDTFGKANGAPDLPTMRRRIKKYRSKSGKAADLEFRIGCLMIVDPVFFPAGQWVGQPRDWPPFTVQGKTYSMIEGEGKRVFEECLARRVVGGNKRSEEMIDSRSRFGKPALFLPRLGQGSFRLAVIEAYESACAVTTEHSLPALEAAHIKPYADNGKHQVSNGLLLRSDIHRLFDRGYVTVTPELRFEVGRKLKEDFENGKSYYGLHGKYVHPPARPADRPDSELLAWHNSVRFKG